MSTPPPGQSATPSSTINAGTSSNQGPSAGNSRSDSQEPPLNPNKRLPQGSSSESITSGKPRRKRGKHNAPSGNPHVDTGNGKGGEEDPGLDSQGGPSGSGRTKTHSGKSTGGSPQSRRDARKAKKAMKGKERASSHDLSDTEREDEQSQIASGGPSPAGSHIMTEEVILKEPKRKVYSKGVISPYGKVKRFQATTVSQGTNKKSKKTSRVIYELVDTEGDVSEDSDFEAPPPQLSKKVELVFDDDSEDDAMDAEAKVGKGKKKESKGKSRSRDQILGIKLDEAQLQALRTSHIAPYNSSALNAPSHRQARKGPILPPELDPRQLGDIYYTHSTGKSKPFQAAIALLPFHPRDSKPFRRHLKELAPSLGAYPDWKELDACLDNLYDHFDYHEAEAKDRQLRREAEDRDIIHAEENKKTSKGGSKTKRTKGEIHIPSKHRRSHVFPFLSLSYGHPPHRDPRQDDLSETEDEFIEDRAKTKGVDITELPPWVSQQLAICCRFIYVIAQYVFRQLASKRSQTATSATWDYRGLKPALSLDSKSFMLEFAHELFGDHMVRYEGAIATWVNQPPSNDEPVTKSQARDPTAARRIQNLRGSSKYATNNEEVMKIIYTICLRTEQTAYKKIRNLDEEAMTTFHPLFRDICDRESGTLNYKEGITHSTAFADLMKRYRRLGAQPPKFMTDLLPAFYHVEKSLLSAEQYKSIPEYNEADAEDFLRTINGLAATEADNHDQDDMTDHLNNLAKDLAAGYPPEKLGDGENLSESTEDWIPQHLKEMDHIELVEHLGLEDCQGDGFKEALQLDKAKAHSPIWIDEERRIPDYDSAGRVKYKDPEAHSRRTRIRIPYIEEFDSVPKDARFWEEKTQAGQKPVKSIKTHDLLEIKHHQLVAAAAILDTGYVQGPECTDQPIMLVGDSVGLGKTFIPPLVIAIRRHHRVLLKDGTRASVKAPVFDGWKSEHTVTAGSERPLDEPQPTRWIGDRRLGKSQSLHLFVSNNTILPGHMKECKRLLDSEFCRVLCYNDTSANNRESRRVFWEKVDQLIQSKCRDGEPPEVIICTTYARLSADAVISPYVRGVTKPPPDTIFERGRLFDFTFFDEISRARNLTSREAFVIRRISQMSGMIIAASATLIVNGATDVYNILRNLGSPLIVKQSASTLYPPQTHIANGATPLAVIANNTDYKDCTPQSQQIIGEDKKLRTQLRGLLKQKERLDDGKVLEGGEWISIEGEALEEQSMLLEQEILSCRSEMKRKVINVLRQNCRPLLIRRSHSSIGIDGLPLTNIKNVKINTHIVKMGQEEYRDYVEFQEEHSQYGDNNFGTTLRRAARNLPFVKNRCHDPKAKPSSAYKAVGDMIEKIMEADKDKPEEERDKGLIYTPWTGDIEPLRIYLAKRGIFTSVMSGPQSIEERDARASEFNSRASHPSQEITEVLSSRKVQILGGPDCLARWMIITPAMREGVSLHNARHLISIDPNWSYADNVQLLGRINRIGQTQTVTAHVIIIKGTKDEDIDVISKKKEEDNDAFLLGGMSDGESDTDDLPLEGYQPIDRAKRSREKRGEAVKRKISQQLMLKKSKILGKNYLLTELEKIEEQQQRRLDGNLETASVDVSRVVKVPTDFDVYNAIGYLTSDNPDGISEYLSTVAIEDIDWAKVGDLLADRKINCFIKRHATLRADDKNTKEYKEAEIRVLHSIITALDPVIRSNLKSILSRFMDHEGKITSINMHDRLGRFISLFTPIPEVLLNPTPLHDDQVLQLRIKPGHIGLLQQIVNFVGTLTVQDSFLSHIQVEDPKGDSLMKDCNKLRALARRLYASDSAQARMREYGLDQGDMAVIWEGSTLSPVHAKEFQLLIKIFRAYVGYSLPSEIHVIRPLSMFLDTNGHISHTWACRYPGYKGIITERIKSTVNEMKEVSTLHGYGSPDPPPLSPQDRGAAFEFTRAQLQQSFDHAYKAARSGEPDLWDDPSHSDEGDE